MAQTHRQEREEIRTRKRQLINIYGPDNYEEGTVVRFYKCFGDPAVEPVYTYIALRVRDDWFYAGKYLAWSELLLELDADNTLTHEGLLEVATEWQEHISNEPPF